jgi:hypothetical protein
MIFEKKKIGFIQGCQHGVELYADRERRNDNSIWSPSAEPFDNTEMRKLCEGKARRALSEISAHRWLKAVAETQSQKEEAATLLAEYRGLSLEVFFWLIEKGLIALYSSPRTSSRTGGKWEDQEIAFPLMTDTPRLEEEPATPSGYPKIESSRTQRYCSCSKTMPTGPMTTGVPGYPLPCMNVADGSFRRPGSRI